MFIDIRVMNPFSGFFLPSGAANLQFTDEQISLRVAPLHQVRSVQDFSDALAIETQFPAFAEKNNKGEIGSFFGLHQFLQRKSDSFSFFLFDNHNHALYFRAVLLQGEKPCKVIHIDQHSDLRENPYTLSSLELSEVFQFSQEKANVGNFIGPALQSGLISDCVQIRTETALKSFQIPSEPFILDIDLDFRAPEMGYIFSEHIPYLIPLFQKALGCTIATSPYFLDQKLAIEMMKKLATSEISLGH